MLVFLGSASLQRGLVLVGFRIDAKLAHDGLNLRRERRHEVNCRRVAIVRAAETFAIECEMLAEIGAALEDPIAEDRLELVDVESSKDTGESGNAGCFSATESERESEVGSMISTELCDALEGGSPGEHRDDGEVENGGEVVDFALELARIGNAVEHLGERQGHR